MRRWGLLVLGAAYAAVVGLKAPEMLTWASAHDVLVAGVPLLLLALGQALVLMTGQIDLSATSSMSFASVLAAALMTGRHGENGAAWVVPAGVCVLLGVPTLVAAGIGACVVLGRMPAFLVSLAALMFFGGAALWWVQAVAGTSSIGDLPPEFTWLGYGEWFGLPLAWLLALLLAAATHGLLQHSLMGAWWRAVGHNPAAARASGVPVGWATWAAFVANGVLTGMAAILLTARLETGTPLLAERTLLLDILGAALIGGCSLQGGRGSVAGVIGGVLLLAVLDKGLQLLGLSLFLVVALKGMVILAAAWLDGESRR